MANGATIRDVAKAAEVSVATVSRILNQQKGFSQETEERVRKVIKELGYRRNQVAWNLKTNSSKTIALITPEINSFFSSALTQGVEEAARREGFVVILCNAGADANFGKSYIPVLSEQQVGGVITCSIPPDAALNAQIRDIGVPCVMVNSISYDCGFPYVKVDDFQGMYLATRFLLDKGHRRIAVLSGSLNDPVAGKPRYNGYRQALRDFGIEPDPELEAFAGNFSYESGKEAFELLLSRTRDFTGIVTCSDVVAAAVLSGAAKYGVRVPEDLSVVGFDDSSIASIINPPLTSVAQPFQKMGEKAVSILLREIRGETMLENRIFPLHIVERDSTRSLNENSFR